MSPSASCQQVTFAGLPALRLELPCGDHLVVAHHGAQVLSWVALGRERLYLSPRSLLDGQAPIRGGIPVCFPQFNQRGPAAGLPKHGLARQLPWTPGAPRLAQASAGLGLSLQDSEATRQWWPECFEASLELQLTPGALDITLVVRNTAPRPWAFTGALHTYLAVDDVRQVRLHGLSACQAWDAVRDTRAAGQEDQAIEGEFDRVYTPAPKACVLQDGAHRLTLASSGWANVVVWNPGSERCAALADMPPDGWQRMLCVEAAQVFEPIVLPPGGAWQGTQRLAAP